jgi:hypothetical protein
MAASGRDCSHFLSMIAYSQRGVLGSCLILCSIFAYPYTNDSCIALFNYHLILVSSTHYFHHVASLVSMFFLYSFCEKLDTWRLITTTKTDKASMTDTVSTTAISTHCVRLLGLPFKLSKYLSEQCIHCPCSSELIANMDTGLHFLSVVYAQQGVLTGGASYLKFSFVVFASRRDDISFQAVS